MAGHDRDRAALLPRIIIFTVLALLVVLAPFACAKATPTPTGSQYDRPSGTGLSSEDSGNAYPTPTPAPRPTSTPRPGAVPTPTPAPGAGSGAEDEMHTVPTAYEPGSGILTQRIIVRTVDMVLMVRSIPEAIEGIGGLAVEMGGWVVSSNLSLKSYGTVYVRVPAERLDEALGLIRGYARRVESENSTSEDFTDEYVDTQARVRNLQATETALIGFLEKAETVEDALKVQAELTKIQEEIERLQGRLGFLDQASAFSLVRAELRLVPSEMQVDAGQDITVREGDRVHFRAYFTPPGDISDFTFEWDFGDATPLSTGARTALDVDGARRVTSTVTHTYNDRSDSPYIVTVKVTGSGEAGAAEGEDTLIATVVKLDPISVYAGQDMKSFAGEEVVFDASFTRPTGLQDFKYEWSFGDGSAPVTGDVAGDSTRTTATHVYPDYRPAPFTATLTITANSDAGTIEAADTLQVTLDQTGGYAGSWSPSNTFKSAVRALTVTGQAFGRIGIWLVILSPVWAGVVVIGIAVSRRGRSRVKKLLGREDDFMDR